MSYEVLIVVDGINEKEPFEKNLKKEGFEVVDKFAYKGETSLPIMNTRAFIFGVLEKSMKLSNTITCNFICQLGENPLEKYSYNENEKSFDRV